MSNDQFLNLKPSDPVPERQKAVLSGLLIPETLTPREEDQEETFERASSSDFAGLSNEATSKQILHQPFLFYMQPF